MLFVVDYKQSEKILNAKRLFINFSLKMEKKLRKISRLINNESSYYMKEKLMINGLVYLEFIKYDEINDFDLEKLNFNKSSLKEYWEAKKFIRLNFDKIKENIQAELIKMFKKIAIYKRNSNLDKKEMDTSNKKTSQSINYSRYFTPSTMVKSFDFCNALYIFDSDEEMQANFKEYLKWKKLEVLEELTIFEDKENKEGEENEKVALEDFLEDGDFKEFIKDLKQRKKFMKGCQEEEEQELKYDENKSMNEIGNKIIKFNESFENKKKYFNEETGKYDYSYNFPINEEENIEILKEKERSFHEEIEAISSKIDIQINKISQDEINFKRNFQLEEKENINMLNNENIELMNMKLTKKVVKEDSSISEDIDEDDNEEYKEVFEDDFYSIVPKFVEFN